METETARDPPSLVRSPNGHNSQGRDRPEPGPPAGSPLALQFASNLPEHTAHCETSAVCPADLLSLLHSYLGGKFTTQITTVSTEFLLLQLRGKAEIF